MSALPRFDAVTERAGIVAELADKFHLPFSEVDETFGNECRRLAQAAKVPNFVVVLATRRTRAILRNRVRHLPGHT